MDAVLAWAQSQQDSLVLFLRELVECESPSDDPDAIGRWVDLFSARVGDIARIRRIRGRDGHGPHLMCEFRLPGRGKEGQLLVLGHSDTVYPAGTLRSMPFRSDGGRLYGPGVFDMKGGLAMLVFAIRALREMNLPVRLNVVL